MDALAVGPVTAPTGSVRGAGVHNVASEETRVQASCPPTPSSAGAPGRLGKREGGLRSLFDAAAEELQQAIEADRQAKEAARLREEQEKRSEKEVHEKRRSG